MNIEVNPRNKRFLKAYETQALIKKLEKVKIGEEVTYKELAEIAMGSCKYNGEKYNFLWTAKECVFKKYGIQFTAVHNVGIRRMNDSEKIAKANRATASLNKKTKRNIHSVISTNYHKLSASDKVDHNTQLAILKEMNNVSSAKTVHKVKQVIAVKKKALSFKEGLAEWKRRNK